MIQTSKGTKHLLISDKGVLVNLLQGCLSPFQVPGIHQNYQAAFDNDPVINHPLTITIIPRLPYP